MFSEAEKKKQVFNVWTLFVLKIRNDGLVDFLKGLTSSYEMDII